jgi:hypothetical protein
VKTFLLLSLFGLLFLSPKNEEMLVLAAGDISCPERERTERTCQGDTVWNAMPKEYDAILAAGDLIQKVRPTKRAYKKTFFQTWPASRKRFYPVPGNHDYTRTNGKKRSRGYKRFLASEGLRDRNSWYDWSAGSWQFVALDSNCDWIDCSRDGRQIRWLRKTLRASRAQCRLAFFHHPLFHGQGPNKELKNQWGIRNIWRVLENHNTDIIINGHWHYYERFPKLSYTGGPGPIRSFTVGTGGVSLFRNQAHPSAEASAEEFGFLALRLGRSGYRWDFVSRDSEIKDSGQDRCG